MFVDFALYNPMLDHVACEFCVDALLLYNPMLDHVAKFCNEFVDFSAAVKLIAELTKSGGVVTSAEVVNHFLPCSNDFSQPLLPFEFSRSML